jgi:tRNA A-37 threonylcarbamoyl transferase component Bud32
MTTRIQDLKMGRYRIVREIGHGAGGKVYEALDLRLDRVVAVKILQVEAAVDPDADERIARFLREARSAARLNHPGIVAVYDSDIEAETGHPFIVMEFINGRSLQELLSLRPRLQLSRIVSIGSQVARALQCAHEHGIIHRDVKPGNLLVASDGRVKLTDFGVARLDTSDLTSRGQFVGTPNYASPEQVEGRPVDGRADLFCLGVVLFRCATGVLPFAADSLTAVSLRIARGEFEDSRGLAPELPGAFHDFLRKALAHDASERFATGEEMAAALEAAGIAPGNDTLAVELPEAVEATPATFAKRRFSAAALAGGALLLLLLAAGGVWLVARRPAAAPPAPTAGEGRVSPPLVAAHESSESSVAGLRIVEQGGSTLTVEHRSHLAEELLVAEVDGREILRKRVFVTGGIFQRVGGKTFRWVVPVAPGRHTVLVRVTGRSMKTRAQSTIEGDFAAGKSSRLVVSQNPYRDTMKLAWE